MTSRSLMSLAGITVGLSLGALLLGAALGLWGLLLGAVLGAALGGQLFGMLATASTERRPEPFTRDASGPVPRPYVVRPRTP